MKKIILIGMMLVSTLTYAAKPIKLGTGGPTGNYFGMTNDINEYCAGELDRPLEILNTGGSIENLLGMGNKKFSGGWVQEDVLQYYARQDPTKVNQNRIKIVTGGHQETVHLLIPKGYEPKSSGSAWSKLSGLFKSDSEQTLDINLLKNQTIDSWGGSIISAKALSYFMDLGLNVVEVPEDRRGAKGDNPILLVGGQPYAPVVEYLETGGYNLAPINAALILQRAPFYQANVINYEVGGEIISIPSVGVRALFMAKSFRKESKNANMTALATCIENNLEDLADDSDTNPNWTSVLELEESAGQTNWNYFEVK